MTESQTTDIVRRLYRLADQSPGGFWPDETMRKAADEITNLRDLLMEIMSAPEAAYHGDWFARATEALPPCEEQDG